LITTSLPSPRAPDPSYEPFSSIATWIVLFPPPLPAGVARKNEFSGPLAAFASHAQIHLRGCIHIGMPASISVNFDAEEILVVASALSPLPEKTPPRPCLLRFYRLVPSIVNAQHADLLRMTMRLWHLVPRSLLREVMTPCQMHRGFVPPCSTTGTAVSVHLH